jgi:hypothetical protein
MSFFVNSFRNRWDDLPSDMPGVRVVKDRSGGVAIGLADDVTYVDIESLMNRISDGEEIWFYDPDYPSPSDPGALVKICRKADAWYVTWTNHGWACDDVDLTKEEAVEYLWAVRRANRVSDERWKWFHMKIGTSRKVGANFEERRPILRAKLRQQIEFPRPE